MAKIFVYGDREKQKNYAAALEGCGIEGLFTLDLSLAEGCDGLLLPGGGDISPARYGQAVNGSGEPDLERDAAELQLVADFIAWGKTDLRHAVASGTDVFRPAPGGYRRREGHFPVF